LIPTRVDWWSLTLVRDLPTHLSGLVGLFLLLPARGRRLGPRRAAVAGLALGWTGTIRPDAVLYLVPATCVVAARWWRERPGTGVVVRTACAGVLGVAIGLAPFLAFNWAATGSPFRPTQGMEIQNFLSSGPSAAAQEEQKVVQQTVARVGFPPGAWIGGTAQAGQGGGRRPTNLAAQCPAD